MARAFENGPIGFGDAKEIMRDLEKLGDNREHRRTAMGEIIKNIKEDIENKNIKEIKGRMEGISPSDLPAIKAQRKINKENLDLNSL